ncbi:MAG: hypothetical protein ACD_41C00027G0002 [uncultured bacterium]|nr:MAG: hypothetical protein ACD_41C00027G0002 [uncultured bacterium]
MRRIIVLGIIIFSLGSALAALAEVFTEDVVTNGNFTTDLSGWTTLNIDAKNNLLDQYPIDGQFLTLGHIGEIEAVRQSVTIPADSGLATLSFYYRFFPETADSGDYLRITVGDISETISATTGSVSLWTEYSLDVSALAGQTVTLELLVNNNSSSLTFADIDAVALTAQSYAELIGTVTDSSAKPLRNAEITIKNHNKEIVWSGTTNKKGKFTATGLPGSSKSYRVKITKGDSKQSYNLRLTWATTKERTFIVE